MCLKTGFQLDKMFHLTISQFSVTISLRDFVFATFYGKCLEMETFYFNASFLSGGKKIIGTSRGQNW